MQVDFENHLLVEAMPLEVKVALSEVIQWLA
jgi:hypothetical protein